MSKPSIIAIDGPAASGKGTLSCHLAKELNFAHMDTGALYRAVGFEVLEANGNPENEADALAGVQALQDKLSAVSSPDIVLHNPCFREERVGEAASIVAAIPDVRAGLLDLQRNFAENPGNTYKGAVLDGRDIGTAICPDADVKIFVTASVEIRAQRRLKELQSANKAVTYDAVLKDMRERDARDSSRETAPLKAADDAVTIDTSTLTADEAYQEALRIVQGKLSY